MTPLVSAPDRSSLAQIASSLSGYFKEQPADRAYIWTDTSGVDLFSSMARQTSVNWQVSWDDLATLNDTRLELEAKSDLRHEYVAQLRPDASGIDGPVILVHGSHAGFRAAIDWTLELAHTREANAPILLVSSKRFGVQRVSSALQALGATVLPVARSSRAVVLAASFRERPAQPPGRRNTLTCLLAGRTYRFETTDRVFAKEHVDVGSLLLAEAAIDLARERVLDFGCGYGPIGTLVASQRQDVFVDLVDSNLVAVDLALKNVRVNGVTGNTSVVARDVVVSGVAQTDTLVSHFPLHISRERQNALMGRSAEALSGSGRAMFVFPVTAKVIRLIEQFFKEWRIVRDTSREESPNERYLVVEAWNVRRSHSERERE